MNAIFSNEPFVILLPLSLFMETLQTCNNIHFQNHDLYSLPGINHFYICIFSHHPLSKHFSMKHTDTNGVEEHGGYIIRVRKLFHCGFTNKTPSSPSPSSLFTDGNECQFLNYAKISYQLSGFVNVRLWSDFIKWSGLCLLRSSGNKSCLSCLIFPSFIASNQLHGACDWRERREQT